MKNTEDLVSEDFESRIDETFMIDDNEVSLKSVDVRDAPSPKMRKPVSLLLKSEEPLPVEDGVLGFAHPDLGQHMLLVHRVADPDDILYEIILA
ncbi:MAG: hypothetical protein GYB36_05780 [Alphaproteobacteria bacterium]|nr:hypothetical protein [Alphaproteobacteria bacterium]